MFKFGCFVIAILFREFIYASELCTEIGEISITNAISYYGKVYQNVGNDYQLNRALYGISVKYTTTTYSTRDQWISIINDTTSAVDFTVIETDFAENDRLLIPNYVAIPTSFGKFIFLYNLPNVTTLSLSVDVIVDIMLQRVTYWNDSIIQHLNPFVDLPEAKIQVIGVSGSSVQNYYLSYFLAHYSQRWRTSFGDKPFYSWPANNKTNGYSFVYTPNVPTTVNTKPYSFSYTTWWFLYQVQLANVKLAKIISVKRENVLLSWSTAAKYVLGNAPDNGILFDSMPELSEPGSLYPFTFFQQAVVKAVDKMPTRSCCTIQEILGIIDFIFDKKLDANQSGGFFPMPSEVVRSIRSSVMLDVACQNTNSYEEFKKYESFAEIAARKQLIMISVPSSLGGLLVITIIVLAAYYRKMQMIKEKFWIINGNNITVDTTAQNKLADKSWTSVGTRGSERTLSLMSAAPIHILQHKCDGKVAFYTTQNKVVTIFKLGSVKPPNAWKRTTKMVMANFCKNVCHINVSLLHGIWCGNDGYMHTVSESCDKGSLSYVLVTCPYALSTEIKYNIAHDVIKGLNYLHNKGIVHGSLNSYSCEVDSLWMVKLTNWSNNSILNLESTGDFEAMEFSKIEDIQEIIRLLYVDPETMKPAIPTFASDVYGYGMLLVEIFNQQTPFFEEIELGLTCYHNLLNNKQQKRYDIPTMSEINIPNNLQKLITHLVMCNTNSRHDSAAVLKVIEAHRGNSTKNIVDIVMKSLESYVAHLEEKVTERTAELMSVTDRMKDLLNQLLPPQIATQFINGEAVQPEFYECATIVFSDIVGFTTISARSTPIQVMGFLNELWKEFDSVAEKFDVYKVDTIGDAYMVASGLPVRNGVNHCKHSADLALALMRLTNTFRIPHLTGEQLKIRLGINSGPVTAGIVGFKMPQYCVFGDTVNTASRMESTSLPYKIQVSEQFHILTSGYFPQLYEFQYRGEMEVKGKGLMKTYWLVGKKIKNTDKHYHST